MASRITREHERNVRSNSFLHENRTDFDGNNFVTVNIAELDAEIANIGDFSEEQIIKDGDARQNYEIAEEAEQELRDTMRDVADYAVTFADEIEGIEEKFRLVRSGGRRGRINRARAFATEAAPYEQMFLDRGLEANFIATLNAKADLLEQSLLTAVSKTAGRIGAVESKMQSHKKSNKIIALLDPIVRKRYRNNPAKLAAWIFASRVERDPKPKTPNKPD